MPPPPLFVSFQGMRGEFRRLRAASSFAHGGKGTKTPPGTRPMGYGCAYAPPRPIGRFPRTPLRGTPYREVQQGFRRAKSEWLSAIPPGLLGPGFAKIAAGAVQELRLALPSQRSRCVYHRRGAHCTPAKPSPRGEGAPVRTLGRMRGQVSDLL